MDRINVLPISARVAAGMALLDGMQPGWDKEIDTRFLDISDDEDCIIGQITGSYETGIDELNIPVGNVIKLGFWSSSTRVYAALTTEWSNRIHERRHAA